MLYFRITTEFILDTYVPIYIVLKLVESLHDLTLLGNRITTVTRELSSLHHRVLEKKMQTT